MRFFQKISASVIDLQKQPCKRNGNSTFKTDVINANSFSLSLFNSKFAYLFNRIPFGLLALLLQHFCICNSCFIFKFLIGTLWNDFREILLHISECPWKFSFLMNTQNSFVYSGSKKSRKCIKASFVICVAGTCLHRWHHFGAISMHF